MKTIFYFFFLGVAILSAGEVQAPVVVSVTKDNVFKFYRSFPRLTKQPYFVAPITAYLCALADPEMVKAAERAKGPHLNTTVHFYANPAAADTIARKLEVFPTGAVLVKEKLDRSAILVSGVAGMIKRAPGFDPEHGDWEYFYSDKHGGFTIGKIKNCAECHATAKAKDHVFRVRRPFE